ncbi:unnamed protein product [Brachionus calyciflorus]|uniref:Uncharacterized protein n=1 Tax=Brachionus calyciflorus TaxID=104777 RepID=A0A813VTE1_9BILA|nr:unnamed protein product [Brachionus calyciflorus]
MIWPRASAALKVKPWAQSKMSLLTYMANESPVVFFSTIVGVAVGFPTIAYLISKVNAEPKGIAHQKTLYTVFRPEDYPKELHQYCR